MATELGVDPEEARKKWSNLGDQFRKEYYKVNKPGKSGDGAGAIFTSKWAYYNSLVFHANQIDPCHGNLSMQETEKCTSEIIHRDLAARNILITDDHTCKIADFGFARDVITSKIYERKSEGKLPIRWMAIESLYDNIFSIKSDIWSFGILMWEIVTLGSTPYPGISAADVMRKVRDGYRLEKPEHCRRELYNIMYYCWESEANERPTFVDLVQMLDKLLQTEMDYIELERFPDHNYYNILNLSGEKL
ncbi:PREDICTED: tyrosine kinase receptor Cad96Ca-like [Rhagoletis zephyria]|uniref:tyrosine kinase receptor Cad96Ca-like n=1 Tax=Rhagoletis zephyria TaxID=28612 RepID=UPI0008112F8F|nr:PREDICTED: tyrosine kinase receptor Cad96Ca-like [Rhagoletis zephyria]